MAGVVYGVMRCRSGRCAVLKPVTPAGGGFWHRRTRARTRARGSRSVPLRRADECIRNGEPSLRRKR